ncbi:hypothetical protein F2P81_008426 [Scophthalmus maximus]|uniref:Uncharacterized protein n=1 Tax=Scophthalmus maximus TaxID=52904 RepID=A0A6A4TBA0_SCOMX|nr:hypothetical protein F2P81_008426 [Scophthalmus maximus]
MQRELQQDEVRVGGWEAAVSVHSPQIIIVNHRTKMQNVAPLSYFTREVDYESQRALLLQNIESDFELKWMNESRPERRADDDAASPWVHLVERSRGADNALAALWLFFTVRAVKHERQAKHVTAAGGVSVSTGRWASENAAAGAAAVVYVRSREEPLARWRKGSVSTGERTETRKQEQERTFQRVLMKGVCSDTTQLIGRLKEPVSSSSSSWSNLLFCKPLDSLMKLRPPGFESVERPRRSKDPETLTTRLGVHMFSSVYVTRGRTQPRQPVVARIC